MNQNGLDILNQSEEKIQLVIENLKKRKDDDDIYKIINGLRNGVTPNEELSNLNQIQYKLDAIEREYNINNQSDDESTVDYAPSWRRKKLSELMQKLYEFIRHIREKYYTTSGTNIKLLDRKNKSVRPTKRKPTKKCKCK